MLHCATRTRLGVLRTPLESSRSTRVFEVITSTSPPRANDNTSPVSEIHAISKDQNNTALPLVDVTTIDRFCSDHNIARFSLLKIDTEGNDLNVIRGASDMLRGGLIDVVVAECSLTQTSKRLVSFSALQGAMREYGYVCFGIYDQSFGERAGDLEINWGNCAFVRGIE